MPGTVAIACHCRNCCCLFVAIPGTVSVAAAAAVAFNL